MPITINGSGTITGLSVGGLPDGTVDADMLASGTVSDNTPAFSVYMNSNVDIDHEELLTVPFQAEHFDSDSAYNTSTGEFTVPSGKGGKYMISTQVVVDGVDTSGPRMDIFVYIDGSAPSYMAQSWSNYPANNDQKAGSSINGVYVLTAGQVVKIVAYHTTGSTESLRATQCWWSMFRLAGV